jgi:predicted transcriptional regulator
MKQTAFVAITILAGLATVFLAPQWRLSAEEPPRLQRQGNKPSKEHGPNRPEHGPEHRPERADRGRELMRNHKPPSHEGVLVIDHLMNRFDEVIARLDRIERRVGAGHNPNGHQPPHGPDHFGNEKRMKDEGRRHDLERHIQDTINDRRRQSEEMAEHVHRTHEEMREQLEERMHHARGMMGQARERFMELNERVEELEEEMRELQERIEALHPPVAEKASQ